MTVDRAAMTDQTIPVEAIEAAARVLHAELNAPKFAIGSCLKCRRDAERMLTSAYPHLRQQIETEVRRQIADEIDRVREDDYLQRQGSPLCEQRNHHDCHMAASQASLDWAARIARGAAQPGGTE